MWLNALLGVQIYVVVQLAFVQSHVVVRQASRSTTCGYTNFCSTLRGPVVMVDKKKNAGDGEQEEEEKR